jgi:hypothetical protein
MTTATAHLADSQNLRIGLGLLYEDDCEFFAGRRRRDRKPTFTVGPGIPRSRLYLRVRCKFRFSLQFGFRHAGWRLAYRVRVSSWCQSQKLFADDQVPLDSGVRAWTSSHRRNSRLPRPIYCATSVGYRFSPRLLGLRQSGCSRDREEISKPQARPQKEDDFILPPEPTLASLRRICKRSSESQTTGHLTTSSRCRLRFSNELGCWPSRC